MILANKRKQKTLINRDMHVAYFLNLNLFCKKTVRPKFV